MILQYTVSSEISTFPLSTLHHITSSHHSSSHQSSFHSLFSIMSRASSRSPTRGGGYGLSAEVAKIQAFKNDVESEDEVIAWIEAVIGKAPLVREDETLGEALRSGEVLCHLVNKIKPESVTRINVSDMPFKQMENISAFLQACRAMGVADHDVFETVDLYEEKDMSIVVYCLYALGRTIQLTVPEFKGPKLGPRMSKAHRREFTEEQKREGRRQSGLSGITAGSLATMERAHIDTIPFGADMANKT